MARRVPILLLGLCLRVLPADAGVLNVCNEGNVTINTAVVERSLSGWRVSGWYPVPARKCEEVFHTSFANVLLGFTYRDANKVMRVHASVPSKREYDIYDMSETFCVKVEDEFEYESRERPATTCRAGYAPLMFGVGVRLTNVAVAWYTTTPRLDEGGRRLGGGAVEVAELLTGVPVQRDGRVWKHRDGSPLSDSLINPKTTAPPLVPRVQFATSREPVAGLLQQISTVANGIASCAHIGATFQQKSIDLNDRGVVRSTYTGTYDQIDLMVLADMNLSQPSLRQSEARQGECWDLEIACKSGGYCGQHWTKEWVSASSVFRILTNSREQAMAILDALRRIAPSYPDATPEIRKLE